MCSAVRSPGQWFPLAVKGSHKPHNSTEVIDRVNLDSTNLAGDSLSQLIAEISEFLANIIAINWYGDDRRQYIMAVSAAADGRTQSQAVFPTKQDCCL